MNEIIAILQKNNLLLLFMSVSIGYVIGNIKFGELKLGETIGALIAGICLSFFGFVTDHELSNMYFSIFMFATGYGSSANIMTIFKRTSIRHVVLTLIVMLLSWITVVFNAKILGFNKALLIGNASGLLTNSAIIGVATDAMGSLASSSSFNADLAESFSVSYFISMCLTVIWSSMVIELIFKRKIFNDSQQNSQLYHSSYYKESTHFKSKRPLLIISSGITLGLLLGEIKIGFLGVSFLLGAIGSLISGILIGQISLKKPNIAYLKDDDVNLLQSFGLSTFIAAIGLSAGANIVRNFSHNGLMLIQVSIVETIFILLVTTILGKYILKYKNVSEFGGAISGAKCASAGCAAVIDKAENNYPVPSFVITFILSNFISILFAPLIVFFL